MSKHDDDTCPHLVRASLLEAENARLQAEVKRLRNLGIKLESMIDPLQAEVEMLRKAGDAMADKASLAGCSECFGMFNDLEKSLDEWNAAKEGKPSV